MSTIIGDGESREGSRIHVATLPIAYLKKSVNMQRKGRRSLTKRAKAQAAAASQSNRVDQSLFILDAQVETIEAAA